MRQRFHGNIKQSRIPKESRTLPVYGHPIRGDGLDAGKLYRCWNCGFICNTDRDALGDSQSRSGVVHETYALVYDTGYRYIPKEHTPNNIAMMDDVLMTGRNGTRVAEKLKGCPFCGSLNYRGDY